MTVLFVNTLYRPHVGGGAEVVLEGMVQGLHRRARNVAVLATHGGAGVLRERVDGVAVTRVPLRNLYWPYPPTARPAAARALWHAADSYNLAQGAEVGRILDEIRPSVVVCHNLPGLSAAVWSACARRRLPLVQVLHDYYGLCPKVTMFRGGASCAAQCAGCSWLRLPHRRASKAVTAVVGVSRAVLDAHLRHGLFEGARERAVIYNARALPAPAAASAPAQRPFTFGYIGALTEIKGVHRLAQAFERVAARAGRALRLLVAGRGEDGYVAHLRRRYESPRVRFLGPVDAASFYAGIDVTVVPSLWNEPLATVVYESIGAGVPVIGARRGGIVEMVQHEVNGLLFEPMDEAAFDAALERALASPGLLESMRRAGRASISHLLDPQRMLDEYEALFARIRA